MSAGSAASARTKRKKLKIRDIEGLREKIFQPIGFGFAVQVDQHQFHVSAKLPENLPAGAAGRRQIFGIGGHRHAAELAGAFGDRLEHRDTFRAKREPVGRILHVAPGVNAPIAVFNRRAHQEFGERCEGIQAGGKRGSDQRVRHAGLRCPSFARMHKAEPYATQHTFTPPTWAAAPSKTSPAYRAPWRPSPALPRDWSSSAEFPSAYSSRTKCRAPSSPCDWPQSPRARSTSPPRRRRWRAGSESPRESRSWGRAWPRTRLRRSVCTVRRPPAWRSRDTPASRPRTYRGNAGPANRRWGRPAGSRLAG